MVYELENNLWNCLVAGTSYCLSKTSRRSNAAQKIKIIKIRSKEVSDHKNVLIDAKLNG